MGTIKTFALAAGMSLGALAASAATLDFTNLDTFTSGGASASSLSASGVLGSGANSVVWTLTSTPAKSLKYNFSDSSGASSALRGTDNGFDGRSGSKGVLAASSGLKLDGDGVGARNDEITSGESVTLTFSKAIRITGIHVLDLFQGFHNGVFGREEARVTGDIVTTLTANQTKSVGPNHGYRFGAVDSGYTVTSLTFRAGATNAFGDDGTRDFALAGVDYDIAPIPLPAGGFLLLTAIGGLAVARRRKQS